MKTALQLLEQLEKIDVLFSAQVAMEETASTATTAQKHQLAQGLDRTEKPITNRLTGSDEYSPSYAKYKGRRKPIDLHDHGDYYRGLIIDVRGDIFIIESTDWKATMLDNNYKALGLGRGARVEYIQTLKPEFVKQIKSYLKA